MAAAVNFYAANTLFAAAAAVIPAVAFTAAGARAVGVTFAFDEIVVAASVSAAETEVGVT